MSRPNLQKSLYHVFVLSMQGKDYPEGELMHLTKGVQVSVIAEHAEQAIAEVRRALAPGNGAQNTPFKDPQPPRTSSSSRSSGASRSTSSGSRMGADDMLREVFQEVTLEALKRSWCLASPQERRIRRRAVILLSAELATIQRVDIFATRTGESAIETIIEGDWKGAEDYARHFRFEEESPWVRARYAPLWEKFAAALAAACAEARQGWPEGTRPEAS